MDISHELTKDVAKQGRRAESPILCGTCLNNPARRKEACSSPALSPWGWAGWQVHGGGRAAALLTTRSWGQLGTWPQALTPRAGACVCACARTPKLNSHFPARRARISSWPQIASRWAEAATEESLFAEVVMLEMDLLLVQLCCRHAEANVPSGNSREGETRAGEPLSALLPPPGVVSVLCSNLPRKPSLDQLSSLPTKQTGKMDTLVAWAMHHARGLPSASNYSFFFLINLMNEVQYPFRGTPRLI